MVKLTAMPEMAIITGFKGRVDFYYHNGVPCARSWPKSPGHQRSPSVSAQWPVFIYASREWANLSPEVQAAWDELAQRSGLCGRDMQIRGYLAGVYRWEP